MTLAASLRKLASEIAKPVSNIGYDTGQVTAVTAGVVTVQALGASQQMPYLDVLPAVGATVGILFVDGSPMILGTILGVPTF